jgi:hypothetical protein
MRPSAPKELELAAILQRLAPDYDRSDVERFAHSLAVAAVIEKAGEGASHGRKGKKRALEEMRQLNEGALALLRLVDGLDATSTVLLDKELKGAGRSVRQAMETLCALANASAATYADIPQQPHPPARKGRPAKTAGEAIARDAGRYFEALTGKPPGRSVKDDRPCGRFHLFVKEIFDVLGIDASVEVCAKAALGARRRARRMEKSVTLSD